MYRGIVIAVALVCAWRGRARGDELLLERAEVRGRVVDDHGAPIAGAVVEIEGAPPATTAGDGTFVIADAPIGVSLTATKDGYGVALAVAAPAVGDVVLDDEAAAAAGAETITVSGEPPPAAPGAARLSRDELEHLPGTRGDLGETLAILPGVASFPVPLGSSGVVIRGSSPQDSKILIDDFEVPLLYHDFAFRSIVPEAAIDSLEYVPGGFDVAYGRATSGLVSLTTRAGGDAPHEEIDSSTGDVGAIAQGPAGDRGHYMVSVRRSVFDLLLPLVLPSSLDLDLVQVPHYYDGLARFDDDLSPRWQLRASAIASDDAVDLYASKTPDPSQHLYDLTRFARGTVTARYHDGPWVASLAASAIDEEQVTEIGRYQHLDVTQPAIAARGEVERDAAALGPLARVALRLGGEAVRTDYRVNVAMPDDAREGEPQAATVSATDTAVMYDGRVVTDDLAAWTSIAADIARVARVTAGARVDAFERAGQVVVQPRVAVAVPLGGGLTARLSGGTYARPPEYQTELLAPGLRAERADQWIAGLDYDAGRGLHVQASLYDTERRDLIVRDDAGALVNGGTGRSSGAELLATYRQGPWFAWLSYAYSHSTRIDAPGDPERLFDYDQPHNLNALASYTRGAWTFGARFRLSSGLPYTPVSTATFDADSGVYQPIYDPTNSARAPLHHQLDLHVERTSRWHGVKLTRFLDVQNVYLDQSAATYVYSADYKTRIAFSWLPILPIVGLRAEF